MITEQFPMSIGGGTAASEDELLEKHERGACFADTDSVRYIIIHCSATREDRDYTADQLRRDHQARGFTGIGYHYYIRRDGTVTRHRRLDEVGAHCRPFNRCSIGICYEGGLDAHNRPKDTRTIAQRGALIRLLLDLKRRFPNALIRGHCEMPRAIPKACPCFKASTEYGYIK